MTRERPSLRHGSSGFTAGWKDHLAIAATVLVLLAMPLAPRAQLAGRVYRIGLLSPTPQAPVIEPFREGLRTLGYVEGQNVVIEHRSTDGRFDRPPDLANEQPEALIVIADPVFRAHHWPSNPLTMGAYTCNQPGYFATIADNEGKPVGNLFFAGEHTSSFYEWQGFMEGGVVSGLRAAAEVPQVL